MTDMTPTKILYVIDGIGRGGTELQLVGLLQRLDRKLFKPMICTLTDIDNSLIPDDCHHLRLQSRSLLSPGGLRNLWTLRNFMRDEKIDIVQTFFQDATLLGATAARLAGVPVRIGSFRDLGFWRTRRQEIALRRVYAGMTAFLANSSAVRDHFCTHDGLDPQRVTVIPNGLDVEAFDFTAPAEMPLRVGIVGNLNRRVKRADLFIEAAGRLAARFPDVQWTVVGDGDQKPALQKRAADLGLADRMDFPGRVGDVASLLKTWDVAVICSDSEGLSNALLEYMLCGCAVVATAVGGNLDLVRDDVTGLLVPTDDDAALADAVGRLLADGALCGRLARAAREKVERDYSWQACVSAHQAFYSRKP
jgi:L-malate glycosyltransferase